MQSLRASRRKEGWNPGGGFDSQTLTQTRVHRRSSLVSEPSYGGDCCRLGRYRHDVERYTMCLHHDIVVIPTRWTLLALLQRCPNWKQGRDRVDRARSGLGIHRATGEAKGHHIDRAMALLRRRGIVARCCSPGKARKARPGSLVASLGLEQQVVLLERHDLGDFVARRWTCLSCPPFGGSLPGDATAMAAGLPVVCDLRGRSVASALQRRVCLPSRRKRCIGGLRFRNVCEPTAAMVKGMKARKHVRDNYSDERWCGAWNCIRAGFEVT